MNAVMGPWAWLGHPRWLTLLARLAQAGGQAGSDRNARWVREVREGGTVRCSTRVRGTCTRYCTHCAQPAPGSRQKPQRVTLSNRILLGAGLQPVRSRTAAASSSDTSSILTRHMPRPHVWRRPTAGGPRWAHGELWAISNPLHETLRDFPLLYPTASPASASTAVRVSSKVPVSSQ